MVAEVIGAVNARIRERKQAGNDKHPSDPR